MSAGDSDQKVCVYVAFSSLSQVSQDVVDCRKVATPVGDVENTLFWVEGNGGFSTLKPSFPCFGDFGPCKGQTDS